MDQNEQPIGSKYVTVLGVVLFICLRHQEYLRWGKPWESKQIIHKERFKKESNKKTVSPLEQDLHPDWDRLSGTMLYPLSKYRMYCKVQMGKDSEEDVFFNSKITLLQKLYCLI